MSNDPSTPEVALPPITFTGGGESDEVRAANAHAVLPSPGYPSLAIMLADAITKRADTIMVDIGMHTAVVRYQVDGMWHNMPPMERAVADYMLAAMKRLAGLDYRERRARQTGSFVAHYMRRDTACRVASQGSAQGERVVILVDRQRPSLETLEDLGMRPRMQEQVSQVLHRSSGLIIISALPQDGLSTTWRALVQSGDRFMRDFYVVEEAARREPDIINFSPFLYDSRKGETPLTPLRSLLLKEPQVIGFTELLDGKQLDSMLQMVLERQIVVLGRLYARSAADALARLMAMQPKLPRLAEALQCVLGQRLVRKLCTTCRQPFQPTAKLLAQLGLPPDRVGTLYKHYSYRPEDWLDAQGNPIEPTPCRQCGGIGYRERTGIFEFLRMDDALRRLVAAGARREQLAEMAHREGHIGLREEGIAVVAKGLTSLEELQRVLAKTLTE